MDKNPKIQKARVLRTYIKDHAEQSSQACFVDNRKQVCWDVECANGDVYPMVWEYEEFGPAMNLKGYVPQKLLEEFLANMVGKEFNIIIEEDEGKTVRKS